MCYLGIDHNKTQPGSTRAIGVKALKPSSALVLNPIFT